MNILEQIKNYNENKQEKLLSLALLASKLKPDFVKAIRNKDVDLFERWEIFCAGNTDLKNHHKSVVRGGPGIQFMMRHWPSMPDLYGRGMKITPSQWFENIYWQGTWNEQDYGEDKDMYLMAMEEILQSNLGSFIYNW